MIELFVIDRNKWNHLIVCKKWAQARLKMLSTKFLEIIYSI